MISWEQDAFAAYSSSVSLKCNVNGCDVEIGDHVAVGKQWNSATDYGCHNILLTIL